MEEEKEKKKKLHVRIDWCTTIITIIPQNTEYRTQKNSGETSFSTSRHADTIVGVIHWEWITSQISINHQTMATV